MMSVLVGHGTEGTQPPLGTAPPMPGQCLEVASPRTPEAQLARLTCDRIARMAKAWKAAYLI